MKNIAGEIDQQNAPQVAEGLSIEEEIEIAANIKECEIKLSKYKHILINIRKQNNFPESQLKDIRLEIFLEEEKLKGSQERLINANISLVMELAKEYYDNKSVMLDEHDFIQEGYLGLIIAARKFKFKSGENFVIFASDQIRHAIEEAIKCNVQMDSNSYSPFKYNSMQDSKEDKNTEAKMQNEISVIERPASKDSSEATYDNIMQVSQSHRNGRDNEDNTLLNIPELSKVKPIDVLQGEKSLLVTKIRRQVSKYPLPTKADTNRQAFIDDTYSSLKNYQSASKVRMPKFYSKLRIENDRRLSLYASRVGERAEEIVIKYLYETLLDEEKPTIKWISKRGETPGWDIEYLDSAKNLVAIEVKGTTGQSFSNIEITGNEWEAAEELKNFYWIYLISKCLSTDPQIQRINNPFQQKELGVLDVTPILWRIELLS